MAAVGPVIARKRARASRETAWSYIADPELRQTWWPDAEFEVVLGGAIAERWSDGEDSDSPSRNAVGVVDVLIAGHAFGFRWRDGADEHETAVLLTLRSQGAETDLMVTETGFGRFPDAFERTADAQQSWIELLSDLAAVLATVEPEVAEAAAAVELEALDANEEAEPEEPEESEELEGSQEPEEPAELEEPAEASASEALDDPADSETPEGSEEPERSEEPAEPDFDSLLRGDTGTRSD